MNQELDSLLIKALCREDLSSGARGVVVDWLSGDRGPQMERRIDSIRARSICSKKFQLDWEVSSAIRWHLNPLEDPCKQVFYLAALKTNIDTPNP